MGEQVGGDGACPGSWQQHLPWCLPILCFLLGEGEGCTGHCQPYAAHLSASPPLTSCCSLCPLPREGPGGQKQWCLSTCHTCAAWPAVCGHGVHVWQLLLHHTTTATPRAAVLQPAAHLCAAVTATACKLLPPSLAVHVQPAEGQHCPCPTAPVLGTRHRE